ncbi:MAG: PstS family phosphate ABC transporter substrate-binding protein [Anaerolineae bacterium]
MQRRCLLIPWILAIAALPLACRVPAAGPQGTITVSGAFALYPLVVRWAEEYQQLNPDVRIDVSAGGAGKGMADCLNGAADVGMVSREVSAEEVARGARALAVAKDAVLLVANARNPVLPDLLARGLTREVLQGIYLTSEIVNWGQVAGRAEVSDEIHVYTRSDAAGAPETWARYLGGKQEDLRGIGIFGDPGILEAVVKDPLGVGYNNLNYAYDAQTGLPVAGAVVLPLDANRNGRADPDELLATKAQALEVVASGRYPSPPARELYLVTKGQPRGAVAAFLRWILTDGQKYVDEVGYVRLPDATIQEMLATLP